MTPGIDDLIDRLPPDSRCLPGRFCTRLNDGNGPDTEVLPFLRRPSLAILAATLLSLGAAMSILVHGYMFHMDWALGDFVPLLNLVIFLGAELHQSFRKPSLEMMAAYASIPALRWVPC